MDYFNGTFTTYHLWTLITFDVEATYYFKFISHLLDVIATMSILINGTLILDLLHTSHSNKTISSSYVAITYACIYYGTRYAPIYITNYASSVRISII